ncbi:MAG TPA: family 43 glycosylhydrolase [Arachnia sp.]|nr:family 43 glycosylhydrolase [Arachnia sp.]HMT86932.1 family 43 glycosylhydrolase [Arachnia sp.]
MRQKATARRATGLVVASVLVAGLIPLSGTTVAQATPILAPAAVTTDPNDGVPRTDPPPTYDRFQSVLDPGSGSSTYFRPFWYDTQGRHIQAHGGQIVTVEEAGETVHYWYGEDRTNGYYGSPGVSVYRSTDLLNWENMGTALRGITDNAQLTQEDYFVDLYDTLDEAGQPKTELVQSLSYYLNTTQNWDYSAIFERPKVLYNEKNDQWVMWWHADGRLQSGGSMYARSMAAVAVADNPEGPFRMTGAFRLYNRANYQACTTSAVPGQARDMTLFQDEDGTAYIVYSSEENNSLYISRLNEDYTNVEHTTTQDIVKTGTYGGSGAFRFQYSEDGQYPYLFADGTPEAPVRGVDFQIVKECGWLEAPAVFTHGDRYYVVASGATGWAPNPQTYHSASDILGTWIRGVEPGDSYENVAYNAIPEGGDGLLSVGDGRRTTFGSQSTNVLTLGPGKYVYMGDRWNDGKNDSTYVWLPIVVGENGELTMRNPAVEDPARWADGWDESYWDDKGAGSAVWSVVEQLPAAVRLNSSPQDVLPATVAVKIGEVTSQVAVEWDASFGEVGRTTYTGRLAADGVFGEGRTFTREADVWEYGVVNLATTSTVTVSSRSSLAPTLIDQNVKGKGWDDWVSGGNYPRNSWLAFDWSSNQRPQSVVVHTYRDGGATWPSSVRVEYKDAGGSWVDSGVTATFDPAAEAAPTAKLDVSGVPVTRGIRLQLQKDNAGWQSVSEVQIFGQPQELVSGNVCRAAGATVSASFHQTEWDVYPATNACDGNNSTPWSTWAGGNNYRDEVTFTLSVGTVYDVSSVSFTNTEGTPQSVSVEYRGVDGIWRATTAQAVPIAPSGTQTVAAFDSVEATGIRLIFATQGTYLKIPEIVVTGTLAEPPAANLDLTATAVTRCVAGKVVVALTVKADPAHAVTFSANGTYGTAAFGPIAAGASTSKAFSSRAVSVAGGEISVVGTAVDDASLTQTLSAAYPATTCG